jgi:hypothetical protein
MFFYNAHIMAGRIQLELADTFDGIWYTKQQIESRLLAES